MVRRHVLGENWDMSPRTMEATAVIGANKFFAGDKMKSGENETFHG